MAVARAFRTARLTPYRVLLQYCFWGTDAFTAVLGELLQYCSLLSVASGDGAVPVGARLLRMRGGFCTA